MRVELVVVDPRLSGESGGMAIQGGKTSIQHRTTLNKIDRPSLDITAIKRRITSND